MVMTWKMESNLIGTGGIKTCEIFDILQVGVLGWTMCMIVYGDAGPSDLRSMSPQQHHHDRDLCHHYCARYSHYPSSIFFTINAIFILILIVILIIILILSLILIIILISILILVSMIILLTGFALKIGIFFTLCTRQISSRRVGARGQIGPSQA